MIVLSLVLAFGVAGCGSKKSTTTTTAAAATTTTATTSSSDGTTSTTATTTASSSGLGSLGSAANCQQLANLGSTIGSAFTGAGGDPSKVSALLQQFADAAPSDIKPDFQTIADAMKKVSDALKGVDLTGGKTPDAATLAKLSQLSSTLNVQALTAASQHIATWAATNCHG
jgi:hypothetical protein